MTNIKELLDDLNSEDDEETWDKKVNKIMDVLKVKYGPVEMEASDLKEALKKIAGFADKLESFGNEPDPARIDEIVNKQKEINKRALERGSVFRRINPDTDAKDHMEKLKNKKGDCNV